MLRQLIAVILFLYMPVFSVACNAINKAFSNKWEKALKCAESRDEINAVKWLKYRNSANNFTFKEGAKFVYAKPHYPDMHRIISAVESKITHKTSVKDLDTWFRRHSPKSSHALKHYLRVIKPSNKNYKYAVRKAWVYGDFTNQEMQDFYKKYKKNIRSVDNIRKVNYMLRKHTKKIPSFLMGMLGKDQRKIVTSRLNLHKNKSNLARIISKVPKKYRTSHLLNYSKALWLQKRNHHHQLAKIFTDNYQRKEFFTDMWSKITLLLVSHLIDDGEYKLAYKIISNHKYKNVINYVDAEWFAGKIAYLYMKDFKKAAKHFHNILSRSKFSTSRSKGAYWSARAYFRLKNKTKYLDYYKIAASYPDTFYGQLAAMKIKKDKSVRLFSPPKVTKADIDWANSSELAKISKILVKNKKHIYARKFISRASIRAKSRAQRYLMNKLGAKINHHSLSVVSGKEVARRGMFEHKYSYPMIPVNSVTKIEHALVNSIIRQESEFDQYAKSHAGAMGLMQIIYPTAKYIAKRLKNNFTKFRLMSNKRLNVKFGSYYLSELIDRYKGSYVLAIAAYNAGPGNVDKWIKRFGDPRKTKNYNEVVGWIEKIPFYETRGYVQNVLSNLQIYRGKTKAKKTGKIKINLDIDLIRRSSKKLVKS